MQENRENRDSRNNQGPQHDQHSSGSTGGIITEYIMEEKDTLPDVARKYGVSIEDIMAVNEHINEPADMVRPGTRLMIPRK